ncbi:MAG: N-acetylmuramoyl-L-alanine amidase [Gemmatimonadota bacterium]
MIQEHAIHQHARTPRHRLRPAAGLAALTIATAAAALGTAGSAAAVTAPARAASAAPAPGSRMAMMQAAAREFGVPARLLLAISWDETRWTGHGTAPSVDGGYGVMNLTARTFRGPDGRGLPGAAGTRTVTLPSIQYTLNEAARLLHLPAASLQAGDRQNIRGAAAVLAHDARALSGGALPASLGGWYGAVAQYSGAATAQQAQMFADGVFRTLARGASLTTTDRQVMTLPATPGVHPDRAQLARLARWQTPARTAGSTPTIDCPAALNCTYTPAAYAQDDPADPTNYGNYDTAGRPASMLTPAHQPASMKIRYIIIHDTEGSYAAAISTFQDPTSYVSANYVVRSADGAVTEMVPPSDVSWGAGDWYVNMHAINIENEGFAGQGSTWYTQAMYQSDAALVRYLAAEYGIPLDRSHILGHEDVPGPTTSLTAAQHWDPGPFWNWNHFMALTRGVSDAAQRAAGGASSRGTHHLVTIDPTFATNVQTMTDCTGSGCVTLRQPASFVYLHTGPGSGYPLVADKVLYPGGGSGTKTDSDWGDKATIGQRFVFAGQSGKWTAVWYSGRRAWFYNPGGSQQKALYTSGKVITPKSGRTSIPVYGAAYPEASAYPSAVPVTQVVKLAYTIRAGQRYPLAGAVPTDYYYAATIDSSLPDDHTIIIGTTPYYQISFNHRTFFVRASDVTVQTLS